MADRKRTRGSTALVKHSRAITRLYASFRISVIVAVERLLLTRAGARALN